MRDPEERWFRRVVFSIVQQSRFDRDSFVRIVVMVLAIVFILMLDIASGGYSSHAVGAIRRLWNL